MTKENAQRRGTRRRVILTVLVVSAIIAAVLVAWFTWPRQTRVTTALVARKDLANTIFSTGTVKPTDRQIVMPQSLPAPIDSIKVHVGASVKPGDLLIVCANAGQTASLSAAKESARQAENSLEQTKTQASSAPLALQGQFAASMATAQSGLAQAQAQLAQAQVAYDATLVHAKITGTVILLNSEGVAPDGTAAPILEVVGQTKQIVVNLSEVDAVHVQPGMPADLTSDAYPDRTWHAHVTRVAGFAADNGSGSGQVEADITAAGDFPVPIGYQMDVHIVTEKQKQATVVPYAALVQDSNAYAVYTIVNGRARKVTVSLGTTTDTEVQVTKGLEPGQTVVINPPPSLRDGAPVVVS